MHSAVLQSKDYIKFADKSTVEVMSMGSLDKGIQKNDRKAARYEGKDGIEYLVEFPNLTVEDIETMRASKAGTYNDTGRIPFTALINPHTEEEMVRWGGVSSSAIIDKVKEKTKELRKEHGKGIDRKTIRSLNGAIESANVEVAKGDFGKAIGALDKVTKKSGDWPQELSARATKARDEIVQAATVALDAIEETGLDDPKAAMKDLNKVRSKLRGTGLEDRAKELLASFKAS